MRILLFVLSWFIVTQVSGQVQFYVDSSTYYDRISGDIDTVDIANSSYATTFDGGFCHNCPDGLSSYRLFQDLTSRVFQRPGEYDKLKFSGLPHLGFAYSFGGQGTQFLHTTFYQAFGDNALLNIDYNRSSGTGFLRNSSFSANNLKVQVQKKGRRYSFQLKGGYLKNVIAHSGGISTDTLIADFGLEFSPVYKGDAASIYQRGHVQLKNYLNLTQDSLHQLGLTSFHNYTIVNREYIEDDTVGLIYNNTYIDSFYTRDQYNLPEITNGLGAYLNNSTGKFYLDVIGYHTYWKYQNLGRYQDTVEFGVRSDLMYSLRKFGVSNSFDMNLIGRFNEWSDKGSLSYYSGKLSTNIFINIGAKAPDPIVRTYFGNHVDFKLNDIRNQNFMRVGGDLEYVVRDSVFKFGAFADFNTVSNYYLFNDSLFLNDTLNSWDFGRVGLKSNLAIKAFHLNTKLIYSFDNEGYLPDFQVYVRPYVKGRLFKARKLEYSLGVDFSFSTSVRTKAYTPLMDYYDWFSPGATNKPVSNLHAFLALGIEEFKFYLRYENIGYFWNDQTNLVLDGYPISGTRFRIGLTWDFFN